MSITKHTTKSFPRNTIPRKSDISSLFAPQPKTFRDHHAEWRRLCALEAVAPATLRPAIAVARTRILESFPQWERPAVMDRLNAPAREEDVVCATAM